MSKRFSTVGKKSEEKSCLNIPERPNIKLKACLFVSNRVAAAFDLTKEKGSRLCQISCHLNPGPGGSLIPFTSTSQSYKKWAHAVKYDQVKYCKHFRAIISKTSVTDAVFAEKTIPQMRFLQVLTLWTCFPCMFDMSTMLKLC